MSSLSFVGSLQGEISSQVELQPKGYFGGLVSDHNFIGSHFTTGETVFYIIKKLSPYLVSYLWFFCRGLYSKLNPDEMILVESTFSFKTHEHSPAEIEHEYCKV